MSVSTSRRLRPHVPALLRTARRLAGCTVTVRAQPDEGEDLFLLVLDESLPRDVQDAKCAEIQRALTHWCWDRALKPSFFVFGRDFVGPAPRTRPRGGRRRVAPTR